MNLGFRDFNKYLLIFALCLPLLSCKKQIPIELSSICRDNSPCLQGKAIIKITTNRGEIVLEVDGNSSPITAGNFLDLVNKGVYKGTVFHRVIKKPFPFIIQGGDPLSKNPKIAKTKVGTGNFIDRSNGQPRFIPLEIKLKSEQAPRYRQLITNPGELSQLQLPHKRGAIAMARSPSLNSASAQFYIALKALPELDGRFSVFGRVIKGMDIVDAIEEGDSILRTNLLNRKTH